MKTIQYMFDGMALKFWEKDEPLEEIDLNNLIKWDGIINRGIKEMKKKYPEGTIFKEVT